MFKKAESKATVIFLLFPLDVIEHDKGIQSYVSCPRISQTLDAKEWMLSSLVFNLHS